jgi:tetratricopeptide (TPR) repeat protein
LSQNSRSRREKLLAAAEGYLMLEMPQHALRSLREIDDPDQVLFQVNFLRGEALRNLERYDEALESFARAFAQEPEDVGLLMGMAWCYKRTDQLHKAISAMEQAYRLSPREAVILYNLSCYWSLAGNKTQALSWLGRALRIDQSLKRLIDSETDFDPLRADPDFRMIVSTVKAAPSGSA